MNPTKLLIAVFITAIIGVLTWAVLIFMAYKCADPDAPYSWCHEPSAISLPEYRNEPVSKEDQEE